MLTVNAGRSSVRLAAFASDGVELRPCGTVRRGTDPEPRAASPAERLTASVSKHLPERPHRVAHRVVHGGMHLTATRWLDAGVRAEIDRLVPLAPLHSPLAPAWMRGCREMLGPDVPQSAVFDTAFYALLPAFAASCAVPWQLAERHGLLATRGPGHDGAQRRPRSGACDLAAARRGL